MVDVFLWAVRNGRSMDLLDGLTDKAKEQLKHDLRIAFRDMLLDKVFVLWDAGEIRGVFSSPSAARSWMVNKVAKERNLHIHDVKVWIEGENVNVQFNDVEYQLLLIEEPVR